MDEEGVIGRLLPELMLDLGGGGKADDKPVYEVNMD